MRALLALAVGLFVLFGGSPRADELDAWCAHVTLPSSVVICSDPILRAEAAARQKLFVIAGSKLSAREYQKLMADQNRWISAYTARCGLPATATPLVGQVPPAVIDCYKRESRLRTAYLGKRLGASALVPFAGPVSRPPSVAPPTGLPLPPRPGLGSTNFRCARHSCRCSGVDDCIDLLVDTNLCGTYITCTFDGAEPECYCLRAE